MYLFFNVRRGGKLSLDKFEAVFMNKSLMLIFLI